MSVQVKRRRDNAANNAAFVGAQGEIVVDTTNNRMIVHDGATAGGFPAAKLSEVVTNARRAIADSAATVAATDRLIAYTSLTAARAVTLCAASAYPTGTALTIVDESGNCSATNTIAVNRAGSDTINGATSAVLNTARGYLALESNGANAWTIVDVSTLSMAQQAAGAVAIAGGAIDGTTIGATTPAAASVAASAAGDSSARAVSSAWVGQNLPGGFVNRFRNGTMDVWQRGTSLTVATAGAYAADGWIVVPTGASVAVAEAGGRLLTKASLQVTGAASVTDVVVKQRIESLIAAALCSQTVTVQAQIFNNTGGAITPTLTVKHAGSQDVWTSPTTDVNAVSLQSCANGAWTRVGYTFNANAASYQGLEVGFDFGNNFSTSGKTVQIAELDIRVTPGVATGLNGAPPPPELRPVHAELVFCQRYFEKSYSQSVAPGSADSHGNVAFAISDLASGMAFGQIGLRFQAAKCALPTVVVYSPVTGASGKVADWIDGVDLTGVASDVGDGGFTMGATMTTTAAYIVFIGHWTASAEF